MIHCVLLYDVMMILAECRCVIPAGHVWQMVGCHVACYIHKYRD